MTVSDLIRKLREKVLEDPTIANAPVYVHVNGSIVWGALNGVKVVETNEITYWRGVYLSTEDKTMKKIGHRGQLLPLKKRLTIADKRRRAEKIIRRAEAKGTPFYENKD